MIIVEFQYKIFPDLGDIKFFFATNHNLSKMLMFFRLFNFFQSACHTYCYLNVILFFSLNNFRWRVKKLFHQNIFGCFNTYLFIYCSFLFLLCYQMFLFQLISLFYLLIPLVMLCVAERENLQLGPGFTEITEITSTCMY